MLQQIVFFAFGLLGTFFHIIAKLKSKGFGRFADVWKYVRENQLVVAFSIGTYLGVFIIWNAGLLAKLMPNVVTFQSNCGWLSFVIAYFSDSVWRNVAKNVEEAKKRNGG